MARPQINGETMERLNDLVDENYQVDASMLTTQQKVQLVLDEAETKSASGDVIGKDVRANVGTRDKRELDR